MPVGFYRGNKTGDGVETFMLRSTMGNDSQTSYVVRICSWVRCTFKSGGLSDRLHI